MLRGFAVLTLLVPLAIGGYLFVAQSRSSTSGRGSAPALRAAAAVLEAHHRRNGTYAGIQELAGVRIARADAQGYCVEALGSHLAGPGGAPAAGGC